jgi:transmembrane sensor
MHTSESSKHAASDKELDRLLLEQSSQLLEGAMRGGEAERRALAEWLSQSKRHVRAHLFMAALEEELTRIDPERRLPIPDVRSSNDTGALRHAWRSKTSVSAARFSGAMRKSWQRAAAVLLVVAGAALYGPTRDYFAGWQEFTTAVGEQRAVSLSDGSIVQLNTGTRIKARISESARDIRLLEGEALFKVSPDRDRPFYVRTRTAAIVAVGTQFNVYQQDEKTRVSVLEGRVRIAAVDRPAAVLTAPIVAAGQEVDVRPDGKAVQRAVPDVAAAAAWVQRRVVFRQESLANVVQQFNRYRKSPRLRVEDPELAARKYSGTFDVDDPRSLEDVLANERDIVLERSGDETVIRIRKSAEGELAAPH